MKKRIEVVGAVIMRDQAVFAARRGPGMLLEGFWEFPGGKIEGGESPQEALLRELREELNCSVEVQDFVTTTEYDYDFGTVVLSTFTCALQEGEPELSEHSEIRWVPIEKMLDLEWAPADVPAVHEVMDGSRS